MRGLRSLCALPASLLALLTILTTAEGQEWHSNLEPHEKYFPEHEEHLRHQWEIVQKLHSQQPVGIRKMMGDPSEKFFLDYWEFDARTTESVLRLYSGRGFEQDMETGQVSTGNASFMLPPLLVHADDELTGWSRVFARTLTKRDFKCPTGTDACTSIGQPNSCCETGETCVIVQNSAVGPVGCCPAGETCNGAVASCDTAQGYTSCPNSPNGGCCIPGFACQDVGCRLMSRSGQEDFTDVLRCTDRHASHYNESSCRYSDRKHYGSLEYRPFITFNHNDDTGCLSSCCQSCANGYNDGRHQSFDECSSSHSNSNPNHQPIKHLV